MIEQEVERRLSPGVHPDLIKLAVRDAVVRRKPRWRNAPSPRGPRCASLGRRPQVSRRLKCRRMPRSIRPTRARRPFDASVDHTEVRSVAGFDPDDRGLPRVNWTLHLVSSPGRLNATLRRGDSNQRHHPRWPPSRPPWCEGTEPLRSPSHADRPRRARSAHRANESSGNTGS
jgi:hypothetical protein